MTAEQPKLRRYRVLYAITRSEYYEVEAESAQAAETLAYLCGEQVDADTFDAIPCEVEDVTEEEGA